MKRQMEMIEGPEAWKRFEGVMKNILIVHRSEVQRRIKEHRKKTNNNQKRATKPSLLPNP
jgi:hypothetical protein